MALATEMNLYNEYIKEIEERKGQGLHPKPIDSADLLNEIIAQIKDTNNANRQDCLKFLSITLYQEQLLQLVLKQNF
jgi:aconitate hydratase 2/2-methylisocitrate dehydratase